MKKIKTQFCVNFQVDVNIHMFSLEKQMYTKNVFNAHQNCCFQKKLPKVSLPHYLQEAAKS